MCVLTKYCWRLVARTKGPSDYNIHLNFDADMIDDSMVTVRGNEYLLGVAFANLLDNACKFSEDKACEVNISQKGDNVVLDFIDKGIGINAEDQKVVHSVL